MIKPADRLNAIQEYYFSQKLREIAQLKATGKDIINLGIGSPDLPPPKKVIHRLATSASEPGNHGYQSYKGIPGLREAYAEWYKRSYHVKLNAETEILPLIGSKEGIVHISMTYLQAGDVALVPNPGYPAYAAATQLAGAAVVNYNLTADNNWMPNLEEIEQHDLSKVKLMWVNYPNMPTGTQASDELFRSLAAFGEKHNILICNDNPYSFILNKNPQSLLSSGLSPYILELNSLSKSHNMAGWRMGVIAAHEEHINNILRFKSNVDSGMFLPIQEAAIVALKQGQMWFKKVNDTYSQRREIVWQVLDQLKCEYKNDQVGMFVWAKAPDSVNDVAQWVDELLIKYQIFITPGFIFGSNGQRYVRISLCTPKTRLEEALNRIKI
ncbi:aminotransferase class I/II-fold pyridoxal phosphate-dependent enzyme [Fulvivirga sp. RKSG066]|uniref:pyridoxal phosphate-dependent aminotransferase n=1 Tax=Fulvivirga aurantia TaxID=2529383 RepID=UPI0012BC0E77|nr:aminotransferase class I/II-fold pyridoxal phosphate-dependent enzyme [Fulvivirga aurantia]MTI22110.1 aminotransferase class I/II-fold pyridoxal phosphate-dependent enzyme [Fulvivirga aurantia]